MACFSCVGSFHFTYRDSFLAFSSRIYLPSRQLPLHPIWYYQHSFFCTNNLFSFLFSFLAPDPNLPTSRCALFLIHWALLLVRSNVLLQNCAKPMCTIGNSHHIRYSSRWSFCPLFLPCFSLSLSRRKASQKDSFSDISPCMISQTVDLFHSKRG